MADYGYDDIATATTANGMVLGLQEIKNENVDLVRLLLFFTSFFKPLCSHCFIYMYCDIELSMIYCSYLYIVTITCLVTDLSLFSFLCFRNISRVWLLHFYKLCCCYLLRKLTASALKKMFRIY